jgi:hypothetical protein
MRLQGPGKKLKKAKIVRKLKPILRAKDISGDFPTLSAIARMLPTATRKIARLKIQCFLFNELFLPRLFAWVAQIGHLEILAPDQDPTILH